MEELFDFALAYPRFRTQVIGLFAGVAALLAAVGIFSVLAYLVGQRTRELAIRRALGAQAADVIRLIVGQGLRLVAIGLVLGLAGALAVARLLEGLLYEISPWDVGTYLGAIAVLGIAALLATLLPAIRAATIDPFDRSPARVKSPTFLRVCGFTPLATPQWGHIGHPSSRPPRGNQCGEFVGYR